MKRIALTLSLLAVSVTLTWAQSARTRGADVQPTANTDRYDRPIPMGVSIGNTPSLPFIYAGTAGLKVRSLSNPTEKYILSNNHVVGAVGPTLCPGTAPIGTSTLQPGTLDIGNDPGPDPFYVVGEVADYVPFRRFLANTVDAGISSTTDASAKTEILLIGEPNPDIGTATTGQSVIKSGRTTSLTNGTVDSTNLTARVSYGTGCGSFRFRRQVTITPGTFSAGGDSGSAILDAGTKTPVALLFAGSDTITVGNPMEAVMTALDIFPDDTASSRGINSREALMRRIQRLHERDDPEFRRLAAIQERYEESILNLPGIYAIGIGRDNGGRLGFKVYGRSRPAGLPGQIEGVNVIFVTSGEIVAR
jgi:hypothetical protein